MNKYFIIIGFLVLFIGLSYASPIKSNGNIGLYDNVLSIPVVQTSGSEAGFVCNIDWVVGDDYKLKCKAPENYDVSKALKIISKDTKSSVKNGVPIGEEWELNISLSKDKKGKDSGLKIGDNSIDVFLTDAKMDFVVSPEVTKSYADDWLLNKHYFRTAINITTDVNMSVSSDSFDANGIDFVLTEQTSEGFVPLGDTIDFVAGETKTIYYEYVTNNVFGKWDWKANIFGNELLIDPYYSTSYGNLSTNSINFQTQSELTNTHLDINSLGENYLSLDGSGDYITAGTTSSYQFIHETGKFTYSAWVNPTSLANNQVIMGTVWNSTSRGCTMRIMLGKINVFCANGSSYIFNEYSDTNLVPNTWQLVTVTFDGTNATYYLNGVPDGVRDSSTGFTGTGTSQYAMQIGGIQTFYFNGAIDDLMVFNRALSGSEVSELYALNRNDFNGDTTGLVGEWTFDTMPRLADDTSGYGNDGSFVGNAKTIADSNYSANEPFNHLVGYYSFDTSGKVPLKNNDFNEWSNDNPVDWNIIAPEDATTYITQNGNSAFKIYSLTGTNIGMKQYNVCTIGKKYKTIVNVTDVTSGFVAMRPCTTTAYQIKEVGKYVFVYTATATDMFFNRWSGAGTTDVTIDSVELQNYDSVYDLTKGNSDGVPISEYYCEPSTCSSNDEGKYSNSFLGNGSTAYVNLGSVANTPLNLTSHDYSLSVWIYRKAEDDNSIGIYQIGYGTYSPAEGLYIDKAYTPDKLRVRHINSAGTGYSDSTCDSCGALPTGNWFNVILTYTADDNKLSYWLNGSYIETDTMTQDMDLYTAFTWIGATYRSNGSIGYVNGSLDDVMIFDTNLSATQIQSIYEEGAKRFMEDGNTVVKQFDINAGHEYITLGTNSDANLGTSVQYNAGYWDVSKGYIDSDVNLVSHFSLDTTDWTDLVQSVNGVTNGGVTTSTESIFGNSASFDGVSDRISLENVGVDYNFTETNKWTYNIWFYHKAGSDATPSLTAWSYGNNGWEVTINEAGNTINWTWLGVGLDTTNFGIDDDVWEMLTITSDASGGLDIYLNGIYKDTLYPTGDSLGGSTLSDLDIGGYRNSATHDWNGMLDDLTLWNKNLSPTEIKNLYVKGLANWSYGGWTDTNTMTKIDNTSTNILPQFKLTSDTNNFFTPYIFSNDYTFQAEDQNNTTINVYTTGTTNHLTNVDYNCVGLDLNYSGTANSPLELELVEDIYTCGFVAPEHDENTGIIIDAINGGTTTVYLRQHNLVTINTLDGLTGTDLTGVTVDCNVDDYDLTGQTSPIQERFANGSYECIISKSLYDSNTVSFVVNGSDVSVDATLERTEGINRLIQKWVNAFNQVVVATIDYLGNMWLAGNLTVDGNIIVGNTIIKQDGNLLMQSPDTTVWNCGVGNDGVFSCS